MSLKAIIIIIIIIITYVYSVLSTKRKTHFSFGQSISQSIGAIEARFEKEWGSKQEKSSLCSTDIWLFSTAVTQSTQLQTLEFLLFYFLPAREPEAQNCH